LSAFLHNEDVVGWMKTKSIFFSLLLFGTACGASDDLSEDLGGQLTDQSSVDLGSAQSDGGAPADGIRLGEDLPQIEDRTIVMRDGQRSPHRTDGHQSADGETPPGDDSPTPSSDASEPLDSPAGGDSSTVDPPADVASSVDIPISLSDPGSTSADAGTPSFDKGAIIPEEDVEGTLVDEGATSAPDLGAVTVDVQTPPDEGPPEPGPCSSSADCPNGVCVGGLCFYDTGGTMNCEEVVLCMAACPDDAVGCDVDCLNAGDGLAQVFYADLWLCWVTSDDFLEIAESCAGKAADCYYESDGPMNCAQAYECTFDCEGQFACVDDCLEQATSLAQTLYTGLAYCLQGACAGSNNPNCKVNNMMVGGVCHIFSDLCGNVPQPQ
jgi:hypothetical protein